MICQISKKTRCECSVYSELHRRATSQRRKARAGLRSGKNGGFWNSKRKVAPRRPAPFPERPNARVVWRGEGLFTAPGLWLSLF